MENTIEKFVIRMLTERQKEITDNQIIDLYGMYFMSWWKTHQVVKKAHSILRTLRLMRQKGKIIEVSRKQLWNSDEVTFTLPITEVANGEVTETKLSFYQIVTKEIKDFISLFKE